MKFQDFYNVSTIQSLVAIAAEKAYTSFSELDLARILWQDRGNIEKFDTVVTFDPCYFAELLGNSYEDLRFVGEPITKNSLQDGSWNINITWIVYIQSSGDVVIYNPNFARIQQVEKFLDRILDISDLDLCL